MLLHLCRCGRPIPQGESLCPACKAAAASRHMEYNKQSRDKRAAAFYVSRAWRIMRVRVLQLYNGIDIVAYFERGEIVPADMVHHIVEVSDDWQRRLDPYNLLPLSDGTHKTVTAVYARSEADKKACQKRLIKYREQWFEDQGGVDKVLGAAFLVPPPCSAEKSPH